MTGDPNAGDPNADPAMQAAMAGMAGVGAPSAPPPPTPTDLAAMEMDQHIQQEIQKLQEKQLMLVALTQRSNEIAGGAPPLPSVQAQAMGAPPPSQNLATGEPAAPQGAAPPGPSMPGGQPSMLDQPPMGGAPGPGMGQPGMDPSMMGQPGMPPMDPSMMSQPGMTPPGIDPSMMRQPGMDPSMMSQPGMDPSMMGQPSMPSQDPSMVGAQQPQQPPMAMMGEDGLSANNMAAQVNPQFLDQAAQLQSDDVFDAAAVSSLAQSPVVKEMIGQYLPNLEKALDNLGRVLLTLWMQETDLKTEIGETTFSNLEDNLRTTTKNMGDLVLKLSQGGQIIKGQFEHEM